MGTAKRYLGIDVGTTAVKAALFTESGGMARVASCAYPLHTPHAGWVEQNPADWIRALRKCVREAVGDEGDAVEAVALSSQGATLVLLDDRARPLCPAISWLDRRAAPLVDKGIAGLKPGSVYRTTGWSLTPGLPLAKLVWLRENRKRLMSRARRVAFTGDYVLRHLTGWAAIDPSSCAITQLYDLKRGQWCDRLLEPAGITRDMLPEVVPCWEKVGGLRLSVARSLGLRSGTPVVAGAHDQYASAYGANVRLAGDIMVATGTAWVQLAVGVAPAFAADERIKVSPCATGDRWGAMIAISYAGASFNWLREVCGVDGFAELDAAAAACPVGADGLRFIPAGTFGGPRGVFVNIDLSHKRGHLARAVMEGVALHAADNIDYIAAAAGGPRRIVMTGGATESRVWPQIMADCVGRSVSVLGRFEAACAGAARLAATGVGQGHGFRPPAVTRRVRPRRRAVAEYREMRQDAIKLGKAIKET